MIFLKIRRQTNGGLDRERRRDWRYPVEKMATLRPSSNPDVAVRLAAMTDVSRSGMRIECAQFLPPGSQVSIEAGDVMIVGMVERCTKLREEWFTAGIKIVEVSEVGLPQPAERPPSSSHPPTASLKSRAL